MIDIELNKELLMIVPLFVALLGLTAVVLVDRFIGKKERRLVLVIIVLLLSNVVQNYIEYRLQLPATASPWRTAVSIFGYSVRPFIIVMFMLLVGKKDKLFYFALALACVNAALYMTAFFSPFMFYISPDNRFMRGSFPWGYTCQIVSGILLAYLLFLSVKECYRVRKVESILPILNIAIIVAAIVADMFSKDNFASSFLMIGMVLCSLFYYLWLHLCFVRKHELALMEEHRNRVILSQIQPHFIYNTLFSIQAIDGNPEETKQAINEFAAFIRGNLAALDGKDLIPFAEEIAYVRDYVSLQKRRFADKFDVMYEIQDADFSLPPLTVQILVENSIKHGILVRKQFGSIVVRSYRNGKNHVIVVEDDGVGFDTEILKDSKRVGLKAVKNRLEYQLGATLDIESEPGKGTKVTINIPDLPRVFGKVKGGKR